MRAEMDKYGLTTEEGREVPNWQRRVLRGLLKPGRSPDGHVLCRGSGCEPGTFKSRLFSGLFT